MSLSRTAIVPVRPMVLPMHDATMPLNTTSRPFRVFGSRAHGGSPNPRFAATTRGG